MTRALHVAPDLTLPLLALARVAVPVPVQETPWPP